MILEQLIRLLTVPMGMSITNAISLYLCPWISNLMVSRRPSGSLFTALHMSLYSLVELHRAENIEQLSVWLSSSTASILFSRLVWFMYALRMIARAHFSKSVPSLNFSLPTRTFNAVSCIRSFALSQSLVRVCAYLNSLP